MTQRKPVQRKYWNIVIKRARRRLADGKAPFSATAVKRASNWPTCACGTADARIPRSEVSARPRDERLVVLGLDFMGAIRDANHHLEEEEINKAAIIMGEIDKRAEIVIQNSVGE